MRKEIAIEHVQAILGDSEELPFEKEKSVDMVPLIETELHEARLNLSEAVSNIFHDAVVESDSPIVAGEEEYCEIYAEIDDIEPETGT